ncbi:MAG TPA: thiamine-phosphate kinase [Thermoplasmata archaeon]|nr:thiamine-phosphate kinase [Thermoplasmata archaeon]
MPGGRPSGNRAIDERGFHAWLAAHLPAGRRGLLPLGDDAADLCPPPGRVAILTTDALVAGTHFRRGSPPRRIGAAATNVSFSDLAAKGAQPAGILLAVLVPPGTPAGWARALVQGAERAAARWDAHVIGGDTKPGPVPTVVGTAVGWAVPGHLAPRRGARPGDVLVTTGTVGRGGAAAEALRARGERPDVLARLLDVRPRVAAGRVLAPLAHAMIDTSDGLAEAARLLAHSSAVRLEVDERTLPLDPAVRRLPARRRRAAAFFGGDYELLAAVPPGRLPAARRAVGATRTRLTVVGRVARGRGAVLLNSAGARPMPPPGWDPFAAARPRGPTPG